jgi:release factor glutamine methyltransferase
MTFIELINYAHNKYKTKNNLVIFELIYWLSKKVKSKEDFVRYRNTCIDFAKTIFNKLLNDYFIKQKPLSQITNTTKFYGLTIKVNHQIFEPRSETEDLVELTIKTLKNNKRLISGADLCCGTGCIGIAIKKHCP